MYKLTGDKGKTQQEGKRYVWKVKAEVRSRGDCSRGGAGVNSSVDDADGDTKSDYGGVTSGYVRT